MINKRIKRDSKGRRTDRVKKSEEDKMRSLYAQHWTIAEIAKKLNRKEQTVKLHLSEKEEQPTLTPKITEGQQKHLDKIESLLADWQNEIKSAQLMEAYEVEYPVEKEFQLEVIVPSPDEKENPLFPYVLQHCPEVKNKYESLKTQRDEYNSYLAKLASVISTEAPKEATEYFSKFAARYAVYTALRQPLAGYSKTRIGSMDFLYLHEAGSDLAIASGSPDAVKHCQKLHQVLINKYKNHPLVAHLLSIREKLRNSQEELLEAIKQALTRSIYVNIKCDACLY